MQWYSMMQWFIDIYSFIHLFWNKLCITVDSSLCTLFMYIFEVSILHKFIKCSMLQVPWGLMYCNISRIIIWFRSILVRNHLTRIDTKFRNYCLNQWFLKLVSTIIFLRELTVTSSYYTYFFNENNLIWVDFLLKKTEVP